MNLAKRFVASAKKVVADDYTMLAIPAFFATMALEYGILRSRRTDLVEIGDPTTEQNHDRPLDYEIKDTAASLAMGTGMLGISLAAAKVLDPLDRAIYGRRLAAMGRGPLGFAGAIVAWDFLYYWDHRLSHEHRLFWANHVNHHSSERYNLSTALRQPWSGFIMHWIFLPMLAAGWTPTQMARAGELNLLYQYWVHTETIDKLPNKVEAVMNTASHHRVHHGANPQYLDKNYAGIFIIWDRLFGTFEPEHERVRYGLTKNIKTFNPVKIAYHEWTDIARDVRATSSWRERIGYTLGPPGWKPGASLSPAA